MPIYMDRHDVPESITAENVAQLHQQDLKIQDLFGCKGLTYWFDDKRKNAFCLIEAPDREAIQKMHDQAHGQVPTRIIEVDPSIVASFLGRIQDPVRAQNTGLNIINDPAFRTIAAISNAPEHHTMTGILSAYEGEPVQHMGHRYLVSFKSVSNAVRAAIDIHGTMKGKSAPKIGLSAGVPVTEKRLIFEDTIKLAERMCEIVRGEIIVSAEVRDLYDSENTYALTEDGIILSLTHADEAFLTLLMDYIDSAWSDTHLKVDDFSKPLRCSKSRLYRKMIQLTGVAPHTFIKEYRLKEALKLLHKNAGNISEIAFETGFSSPSYFAKCFQKRYGRPPSGYLRVNTA